MQLSSILNQGSSHATGYEEIFTLVLPCFIFAKQVLPYSIIAACLATVKIPLE